MKYLANLDLAQNELQNAVLQPLAAAPSNPKLGQFYYSSADLTMYQWDGATWKPVPKKTSQLENDSGFLTGDDIPEGAAASNTTPKMDGTAAVGTEMAFARGDHVHPSDTGKLSTNGNASNVTAAFTTASSRELPATGETLAVLFGKILKYLTDTKNVAYTGSYNDLTDKPDAAGVGAIPATQKGTANGVAELDNSGKVPAVQLPAYVDDVVEYDSLSAFPKTGETGKIYVATDTNLTYRWSGSQYVEISPSLALGETSSTAFRGDWGKIAYDFSQAPHAPADAEANVQSDWNETDSSSDAFIKNKPVIPAAVRKTVETMTGSAEQTFTVSGYILNVMLVDSVTKEQVMGDVSFPAVTASVNNQVTVSFSQVPANPILVVITSLAA